MSKYSDTLDDQKITLKMQLRCMLRAERESPESVAQLQLDEKAIA